MALRSERPVLADIPAFIGSNPYLIPIRILVVVAGIVMALLQKVVWNGWILGFLISVYVTNPYFATVVATAIVCATLFVFYQIFWLSRNFYLLYMTSSLELSGSDLSYQAALQWINEQNMKNPFHVDGTTTKTRVGGKVDTKYAFSPLENGHTFKFRNNWIHAEVVDTCRGEILRFRTTGRSTQIFQDLLHEARKFAAAKDEGKTIVYRASRGYWNQTTPRQKRPMDSVVLDEGIAGCVMDDLEEYLGHAEWYYNRGIPYRRGYLLYGPPGTGKTSFITALAGHYNLNICILNLSEKWLDDENFNSLLTSASDDSILLLEDVDSAFVNREEVDSTKEANNNVAFDGMSRLTFSGFLNALDGVASGEGRILFMTTNYVDRLDPAMMRPGRVDVKKELDYASDSQLEKIYLRFYPEESVESAKRFATEALKVSAKITLAQVQGLFLLHKHDPQNVFQSLDLLSTEHPLPKRHNV